MTVEVARRFARHQRGLISRSQAFDLGLTPGQIATERRTGRWRLIQPHVFLIDGAALDWHGRVQAAQLGCGGLAFASTAAALFRLPRFPPAGVPAMLVAHGQNPRVRQTRVHRTRHLDDVDTAVVDGIRVTGLIDTIHDVGIQLAKAELVDLVDVAVRDHSIPPSRLHERAVERGGPRRGGKQVLAALAERHGDQRAPLSAWSRQVQRLLADACLGRPTVEHRVVVDGRLVAQVDLAYPDHRLAIELDSRRHHLNTASFESDSRRRNRLASVGWTVLTLTWDQTERDPSGTIDTVRSVLTQRSA